MAASTNGRTRGRNPRGYGGIVTPDYRSRPVWRDWDLSAGEFNVRDVDVMRFDSQVAFLLRVIYAPLPDVKWAVEAKTPEVGQWVKGTLTRVWERELAKLFLHVVYGWMAAEIVWDVDEEAGTVAFGGFADFHPFDVTPLQQQGKLAGIAIRNVEIEGQDKPWLVPPRSFYLANEPEFRQLWGRSRLRACWEPWKEKAARHGAREIRRMWFLRNAYRSGYMRYPGGSREIAPGVFMANEDIAREIAEKAETGHIPTMPSDRGEDGNYEWEWQEPVNNGDIPGVHEYIDRLDRDIFRGGGVPLEIVEAAETGSGWSGRNLPFLSFLKGEDAIVDAIGQAIKEQVLDRGVSANFGPEAIKAYRIKAKSLVPEDEKEGDGKAGGGDAGAQSGLAGNVPEAMPGGKPAMPQQPQQAAQPVQMSQDGPDDSEDYAHWLEGTLDLLREAGMGDEADALEEELTPDGPVQMAMGGSQRAPKGGISFNGRQYRGGQFIPAKEVESASPADKAKLAAAKEASDAGRKTRDEARAARGDVDAAGLAGRLKKHADTHGELATWERRQAAASARMIARHHGAMALHRIDELAGLLEKAHAATDDPDLQGRLSRRLAMLHQSAEAVRASGVEGKVPEEVRNGKPSGSAGGDQQGRNSVGGVADGGGVPVGGTGAGGRGEIRGGGAGNQDQAGGGSGDEADAYRGMTPTDLRKLAEDYGVASRGRQYSRELQQQGVSVVEADLQGNARAINERKAEEAALKAKGEQRAAKRSKAEQEYIDDLPKYTPKDLASDHKEAKLKKREFQLAAIKDEVAARLAAGKPVPPEVLADYPDLAKPPATPAPGFTGTDAQGREWQDGELVAKGEEGKVPEEMKAKPAEQGGDIKAAADQDQTGGYVYDDGERQASFNGVTFTIRSTKTGQTKSAGLFGAELTSLPPALLTQLAPHGVNADWFAVMRDGHPVMVMPPGLRPAAEKAHAAANGEAARARREVGRLEAKADSKAGDIAGIQDRKRADEALVAWKKKYPKEAAQEEARNQPPATPAPAPGFTGTDAQGREWRDGELVTKREKKPLAADAAEKAVAAVAGLVPAQAANSPAPQPPATPAPPADAPAAKPAAPFARSYKPGDNTEAHYRAAEAALAKEPPPASKDFASLPPAEQDREVGRAAKILEEAFSRLGGTVKVPDVADAIQSRFPGASAEDVRKTLERMQAADQLTLQVADNVQGESRVGEMYPSPRGVRGYVSLRPGVGEAQANAAQAGARSAQAPSEISELRPAAAQDLPSPRTAPVAAASAKKAEKVLHEGDGVLVVQRPGSEGMPEPTTLIDPERGERVGQEAAKAIASAVSDIRFFKGGMSDVPALARSIRENSQRAGKPMSLGEAFDVIDALSRGRLVELHKLNEVASIPEAERHVKGIQRNGRFYHYTAGPDHDIGPEQVAAAMEAARKSRERAEADTSAAGKLVREEYGYFKEPGVGEAQAAPAQPQAAPAPAPTAPAPAATGGAKAVADGYARAGFMSDAELDAAAEQVQSLSAAEAAEAYQAITGLPPKKGMSAAEMKRLIVKRHVDRAGARRRSEMGLDNTSGGGAATAPGGAGTAARAAAALPAPPKATTPPPSAAPRKPATPPEGPPRITPTSAAAAAVVSSYGRSGFMLDAELDAAAEQVQSLSAKETAEAYQAITGLPPKKGMSETAMKQAIVERHRSRAGAHRRSKMGLDNTRGAKKAAPAQPPADVVQAVRQVEQAAVAPGADRQTLEASLDAIGLDKLDDVALRQVGAALGVPATKKTSRKALVAMIRDVPLSRHEARLMSLI